MNSSRIRTARSSSRHGGVMFAWRTSQDQTPPPPGADAAPEQAPPEEQTAPPEQAPPEEQTAPPPIRHPRSRHPPWSREPPRGQTPPCVQTDTCKTHNLRKLRLRAVITVYPPVIKYYSKAVTDSYRTKVFSVIIFEQSKQIL